MSKSKVSELIEEKSTAIVVDPLDDRVVIRSDEPKSRTQSGLFLPDNAQEKPSRGTVLAVGPGRVLDSGNRFPPVVEVGDSVIYSRYAGNTIEVDGQELLIVRESDVLAVIREEPPGVEE